LRKQNLIFIGLVCIILIINCTTISPHQSTSTPNLSSHPDSQVKSVFRHISEHKYNRNDSFQLISQYLEESISTSETIVNYLNENQGKIIGTTNVEIQKGKRIKPVKMVFIIDIKDNRFRLTFKNFIVGEHFGLLGIKSEYLVVDKEELMKINDQVKKMFLSPLCEYFRDSESEQSW